jgi:microcystin-dependent protein
MPYSTPDTIPAALTGRLLLIPNDLVIIQTVLGQIYELAFPSMWQQVGAVTPQQIADAMQTMAFAALDGFPSLIGTVFPIITALPPDGSVLCDGTTYLRSQFPLLYDLLAPIYQIDADHFYVPDLRGRTIIAAGTGSGLTPRAVGDSLGEETHQLTVSELASHTHSTGNSILIATATPPPLDVLGPNILPASTGSTGGDAAHNNMQPSYALNYAVWAI